MSVESSGAIPMVAFSSNLDQDASELIWIEVRIDLTKDTDLVVRTLSCGCWDVAHGGMPEVDQ